MNCKAVLEPGAAACVECGTKLGAFTGTAAPTQISRNKISYNEDQNGRNLDADFSDMTMQAFGDVIGAFFASRGMGNQRGTFSPPPVVEPPGRSLPPPVAPTPPSTPLTVPDGDLAHISGIFRANGIELELIDNRLKAKSGVEFVRRLTYLFLYAHELHGRQWTTKTSVIAILKEGKVWDGNASKWLAAKKGLRATTEGDEERFQLFANSRDDAKKVLQEAIDASIKDEWNPDTKVPQKRAARKKTV